jgi:hypothetical protein
VTKPVSWLNLFEFKTTVVDGDTFCVVDLWVWLRLFYYGGLGVIAFAARNSISKAARWVDISIENVYQSVAKLLASSISPKNGGNIWMVNPFL